MTSSTTHHTHYQDKDVVLSLILLNLVKVITSAETDRNTYIVVLW